MKPFNGFDQSVPAPEFGAGVVIRFTMGDLRTKVEPYADMQFGKIATENNLDLLAGMKNWTWLDFALAKQRIDTLTAMLDFGLKQADGVTPVVVNWDDSPRFSVSAYSEKVSIALLASIEGMTVEQVRERREKEQAKFEAQQNPTQAQAEAS